jgi:Ni/Fe-hydrogenase subunit HybB-like protein
VTLTPNPQTRTHWMLVGLGVLVMGVGLAAAHRMELHGHAITGMNNQVVWGLPHVFAIFMIVAASGVLNVAAIGSVFGQAAYKPRAALSGLLCLALLAGGLLVLMLDLGRPDRVLVAATHFNFKSVFAWNVFLYSGMAAIVAVYLWTMFEHRMNRWSQPAGLLAMFWRIALTTGTGSIFGFLVARPAYQSALLAPLFIVLSLAWGLAVFLIVQAALYAWNGGHVPPAVARRMARLLGIFGIAALYLVAAQHLNSLYFARQHAFEAFTLFGAQGGAIYAVLFWGGYVIAGTLVPLLLLFHPRLGDTRCTLAAAALVVAGAFAWLFAFIIGGQAFPMEIFPGHVESSRFGDGAVATYVPSVWELLLGLGGAAAAFLITLAGVRVLDFMPRDELAGAKGTA